MFLWQLIHPLPLSVTPFTFPTIGIRAFGACRKRFQRSKPKIRMSYKREIPRLNRDNFLAWQGLMRLHLATVGDTGLKYLDEKYEEPSGTLSVNDIAGKKTHNNMMIDIASALSYEEFDDIKDQIRL